MNQELEARRVVREIWNSGIGSVTFEDPFTPEYANAALSELVGLREHSPGIYEDVLHGADLGAGQLAVEDTHGLMELVQNADDQRATRIRFGVFRKSGRPCLFVVHNGDPITVGDTVAMCFAFVSTKRHDSKKKGKFGIGLKTLSRLADRFEVHCGPYHFAIAGSQVEMLSRPRQTKFYDPRSSDTLLILPLRHEYLADLVKQWVQSWKAKDMLFLDYLRELSWMYLPSGRVIGRRLKAKKVRKSKAWRHLGKDLQIEQTQLNSRADEQYWTRYDTNIPVPKKLTRAFKATGSTTEVSVAIPVDIDTGVLHAGLPTKIQLRLPYIIGAEFDPNTARTQIQQSEWNQWLWKRIADFVAALSLDLFDESPAKAWQLVPTLEETSVGTDDWVEEQVKHLRTVVSVAIRRRGTIVTTNGVVRLAQISYEEEAIDGFLTQEDYQVLAPSCASLPIDARDSAGRWRVVLEDLQIGSRIEIEDALRLLPLCADKPLSRSPEWYVQLVGEALKRDLGWKLADLPCVLVTDPVELVAPESSGVLFSVDDVTRPLSARLGLVRKLHDSLLGEGRQQEGIRAWLEEELERLWCDVEATTVLEVIARRGEEAPLELSDEDLVELRDLIDEIDEPDSNLLARVGRAVAIDAYRWNMKERRYRKETAGSLYLPPTLSEADGWPKAAGQTPDLKWAAPRYATLLDPKDRRSGKSGARKILTLLGAQNVFRLVHVPTREIKQVSLPTLQDQSFQQFLRSNEEFQVHQHRPRSLKDDYISPDLEAVVEDICRSRGKERYERGLALLKVLDRTWRRSLQQKAYCAAGYLYRVTRDLGDVRATWIAELAEWPWLYNENRKVAKPLELSIRTPLTESLFGEAKSRFARGIKDDYSAGLLEALGFEKDPEASTVVGILAERRADGHNAEWAEVHPLYKYLASLCPVSSAKDILTAKVGDMTVQELRGRFGISGKARGLIAIDKAWKPPTAVYSGRRIFGARRSFVPKGYENLWRALGVRGPRVKDCVEVLQEIAAAEPNSDSGVVADTLRHLDKLLDSTAPKDLRHLESVPLWLGSAWSTQRPIYFIADETASLSLSATHSMWRPPCSLEGMEKLVDALGVEFIPPENCTPTGIGADELENGTELREQYLSAIESLKDYLAKNEPAAYRQINVDWSELSQARIAIAPRLGLDILFPNGEQVSAQTNAHLSGRPLMFCIRDESLLFDYNAGARIISQCFLSTEHRQIVRLAWSNRSVLEMMAGTALTLAEEEGPNIDEDPLLSIKQVADGKVGKPIAGTRKILRTPKAGGEGKSFQPSRLKKFDAFRIDKAVIVNEGAALGKRLRRRKTPSPPDSPQGPEVGSRPTGLAKYKEYPPNDKEQKAMQLLEGIVQSENTRLRDFTRVKGLGADAGDELGRLFEVKAHGGNMPDQVNIQLSQRRAAADSPGKFYLAVVAGLEEGYETIVKLFHNPMETLDLEEGTSIKLSGIHSKRALEVRISAE